MAHCEHSTRDSHSDGSFTVANTRAISSGQAERVTGDTACGISSAGSLGGTNSRSKANSGTEQRRKRCPIGESLAGTVERTSGEQQAFGCASISGSKRQTCGLTDSKCCAKQCAGQ